MSTEHLLPELMKLADAYAQAFNQFGSATYNPITASEREFLENNLRAALLSADSKALGKPVATAKIGTEPHNYGLLDIEWHAIVPAGTNFYARPQQQAKPMSESQWEEIASLVGCVKITPRGRAAIMRVINAPDSGIRGKDQA
jgi:hypothetical protein